MKLSSIFVDIFRIIAGLGIILFLIFYHRPLTVTIDGITSEVDMVPIRFMISLMSSYNLVGGLVSLMKRSYTE